MAGYRFPLERVLWFKEQKEKAAELRQRQALAAVQKCETEVAALREQLDQLGRTLRTQSGGVLDLTTWLACHRRAGQIGQSLTQAEERARQASRKLLEATSEYKQKAIEAEALRLLRQRKREEHLIAADRAEQIRLDDIGMRRWSQNQTSAYEERKP